MSCAAVNAGVSAATAREGFRLADASLTEECGALCSPGVAAGRSKRPQQGAINMKGSPKIGTKEAHVPAAAVRRNQ